MPRDAFHFRSRWPISQRGVDFAKERHFSNLFHSCKMRVEGCEMGARLRNVEFLSIEDFASISQLWNEGGGGFAKWHPCAKGSFHRGGYEAAKSFRSGGFGAAKLFRSQGLFSQGPFLGCEISQTMHFPCFWAPLDSQFPYFNFSAIPPDFYHSKRLCYI